MAIGPRETALRMMREGNGRFKSGRSVAVEPVLATPLAGDGPKASPASNGGVSRPKRSGHLIQLWLSSDDLARLDRARGSLNRSVYLRGLIPSS